MHLFNTENQYIYGMIYEYIYFIHLLYLGHHLGQQIYYFKNTSTKHSQVRVTLKSMYIFNLHKSICVALVQAHKARCIYTIFIYMYRHKSPPNTHRKSQCRYQVGNKICTYRTIQIPI